MLLIRYIQYYYVTYAHMDASLRLSVRSLIVAFCVLLVLIDLSENAGDLLLEERLEILLRLLVQVVLLAELLRQIGRCVAFIHHDTLLLVCTQVDVHEEQGRVGIIEVIIVLFALGPIETIFFIRLLLLLHLVGV